MDRVFGLVLAFVAILALNLAANFMAQKIYPTLYDDGFGKRYSYRLVFIFCLFCLLAACMAVLFVLDQMGFRL